MKNIINELKDFFVDVFNIFKYVYDFGSSGRIARLRIFLVWLALTLIPTFFIYFTINAWQVHIPNLEGDVSSNGLVSMLLGTSILPILFFFTKGLRGYHKLFSNIIRSLFNNFVLKSSRELEEEFGEEGLEKLRVVNLGQHVSGFLLLEFIIIGWATFSYFAFGGNMTGLAWFGYIADDLLLGALVFILEAGYCVFDAIAEAPNVYKLKPLPFIGTKEEIKVEDDPWVENEKEVQ